MLQFGLQRWVWFDTDNKGDKTQFIARMEKVVVVDGVLDKSQDAAPMFY